MNEEVFGDLLFSQKKSKLPYIIMYVVIVFLTVLVLFYYFFGCAIVNGQSMENTIDESQRCMLIKRGFNVDRGDIITINHPKPDKNGDMLIKRAIALGGDKILFVRSNGNYYVDMYICKAGEKRFTLSKENYLKDERMLYGGIDNKFGHDVNGNVVYTIAFMTQEQIESTDITVKNPDTITRTILEGAITVPKDSVYYMGDNRNHSSDSRYYGPCKLSDITGKVIKISKKGSALEGFLNFMFSMY